MNNEKDGTCPLNQVFKTSTNTYTQLHTCNDLKLSTRKVKRSFLK